jgi:hypothetical protein
MGAGTLVELIARGNQDAYLIGNPQFSYFKSVYKRHTNFSIEPIRQIFSESPNFGKRVVCTIEKKADLLNDVLLELELPALGPDLSWTNGIGYFMIDFVELQLGGEPIDRITGDLLDAWMELTTQLGIKNSLYTMIGKNITFNKNSQTGALKLLMPLPFWFTRSIDRALPLISMQYIDVRIVVQFKSFDQCWFKLTSVAPPPSNISITKANLLCNFIYLDVFERVKMAANAVFEYLIEQFQISPVNTIVMNTINYTARMFFNHPVKELIWMYRTRVATNSNDYYNYANILNYDTASEIRNAPFDTMQIKFNGNDRFEMLPYTYFTLFEPYKVHSCGTAEYIHVYSFALNPESVQPSGTCNFSKLDNVSMYLACAPNIQDGDLFIFATNYNILRIQSGMAGVMFSS